MRRRRQRHEQREKSPGRVRRAFELLRERHAEQVCGGLLALVVVGSALAVGTVHVPALLVAAPLAIGCGCWSLWLSREGWRDLPPPFFVFIALAAFTALQAIPLPVALLSAVAPRNVDVWNGALRAAGDADPRWLSVSLDPGASLVEVLKWLSYGGLFVGAAYIGRARGATWLQMLVFASSVIVALVTLGHKAADASRLYGIYQPEFAHPNFSLSPLLNSNNLAGYLNLGSFAGIGVLISRRQAGPRWLIAIAVSVSIAVSTLTASRGGWLGLIAGVPLLLLAIFITRARQTRFAWSNLWIPIVPLVGGVTLFLIGASDAAYKALSEEGLKKIELIAWSGPMISENRWLGVGRGAFETSFPVYRKDVGHHLYAHAENFVAQWAAEWGVPVALAALVALVWMFRPQRLGVLRSTSAAAAVVGVAVLLLQNLFDLALEIPSVGFAVVALLGGLWGAAARRDRRPDRQERSLVRPQLWLAAACGAAITFVALFGMRTAGIDRRELSARVDAAGSLASKEQQSLLGEIVAAIRRHPADPHLPLLAAVTANRAGSNPLPWIGRAIERDPMSGRPHILLAHVLASRGHRSQALLATRMAVERDPGLTNAAAKIALAATKDFESLLRAVPAGPMGAPLLVALARECGTPYRLSLREKLLEEAISRDPASAAGCWMRANDLLRLVEAGNEQCTGLARARCVRRVTELAELLSRAEPKSERPLLLRARVMLVDNRAKEAEHLLASNCERTAAHLECLKLRVTAAEKLGDTDATEEAMQAYLETACASSKTCAAAASLFGDKLFAKKDWEGAARMYERAARLSGDRAAWDRVAKAAIRAGDHALAMRAWQKARSVQAKADDH